jgi:hypothetical protein
MVLVSNNIYIYISAWSFLNGAGPITNLPLTHHVRNLP